MKIVSESRGDVVGPGAIRGNSFRREAWTLTVLHADRWTLFFDSGEGTPVETRAFSGSGAVTLRFEPLAAWAVRNDGAADLHLIQERADPSEERVLVAPPTRIAGVDGCRRGWIAVVKDGAAIEPRVCESDGELVALFGECAVVAIDIPIGLSDGPRFCDQNARQFLGKRASSVFPAPPRSLLKVQDYADANRLSRQLQQRGISKQCWAIVPKVAQIDRILQKRHELRSRVREVHPEVSFTAWAKAELPSKHSAEGAAVRRALVAARYGELPPLPRGVREDDLLDAFAALWTAERIFEGRATPLGDEHRDVTGLPMRIVY